MKNKIFHFLLPLLASAWLAIPACTLTSNEPKYKPAAGRVLEYGTLTPIEGAIVTLYACEGELLGSFSCKAIDSILSGNDGRYDFTQTGFLTNARKNGYFSDNTTEAQVLFGSEDKADIILPPYAWLKVTLRNESGAYGIGSSQLLDFLSPPILVQQKGKEYSVLKLVKGNKPYKLIFFLLTDPDTSSTDTTKVKILDANGNRLPITVGVSLSLLLAPVGHDTTDISIIY